MIQSQLVLVQLRQDSANVQVGVSLDLGSLQARLNRERPLEEVQGCAHLSNAAIVASHVVEGHGLSKLVVLAQLLRLLEEVERAVDVLLLQVVDCEDVTDFAQLLAGACELTRCRAEVHLLDLE